MTPLDVIEAALGPLDRKRLLDVGCGSGDLTRSLARTGAVPIGLDPSLDALRRAHAAAPDLAFVRAIAEALPVGDGAVEGVVFLNSLHHVPEPAMSRALREAGRVTSAEGAVVVIEPLAAGSFFAVVAIIEDETEVRAAAQDKIAEAVDRGEFELVQVVEWVRRERFNGVDDILDRLVQVDPARADIARRRRPEVEAVLLRSVDGPDGPVLPLEQPMRAHLLRPA